MLRWFVLPKQQDAIKGLVIFILGVAMAESCGVLGTFMGGEYRTEFFVLGVIGILQWIPWFARRFYRPAANDVDVFRLR